MKIRTSLSQSDAQRANMVFLSKKKSVQFMFSFLTIYFLFTVYLKIVSPAEAKGYPFLFPMFGLILFPLFVRWTAKKQYKRNKEFHADTEIEILEDRMILEGGPIKVDLYYSQLKKVMLTKEWLFLSHSKSAAIPISRKNLGDKALKKIRERVFFYQVSNNLD